MTTKNACLLFRSLNFNITRRRTLFSESYLGLDKFKTRMDQEAQSSTYKKKFENIFLNPELKVYGHDMKRFVYLINTEEDFKIFCDLFERYAKLNQGSTRDIKFQIFNLGPEIMRTYYIMNKPHEAFNLLKNPDAFLFICNLKSLVILQDLLYENGMYQEVCDVFYIIKEKQFFNKIFHSAPYILFQAACYKMDTSQSYDNVIALYERFIKHNSKPDWLIIMYTAMCALKNCSLDIPLKHAVDSDPTSVNIKLSALIKSGNYSGALSFCDSLVSKSVIMKSVAQDLCKPLESDGTMEDESLLRKLQKFQEDIVKENLIDKTLDELAANSIHSLKKPKN